jgi:DNA-binding LacI/PurR family transcriptional regulator
VRADDLTTPGGGGQHCPVPSVTLQTIADRVGVSRMTVSNAFSRPDQLSDELRERILAAADELGYVGPDPAARALARGATGAVGVLLTDSLHYAFTDEVATGFLAALVEGLAPTGLALTLLSSTEHDRVVPARDVAIDGALIYSCRPESTARAWLLRRKLPVVFVDQAPTAGIDSVNVEDRAGARAAARHLVDLGHRRIGIVLVTTEGQSGLVDDPAATVPEHTAAERLAGWLDVLAEAGISPTVVLAQDNKDDEAETAARLLLAATPAPTGVLCFSDVLALGVARTARRQGLAVPADLSVVGFDDSSAARHADPALTTVHQDVAAKGRLAAEALTAAIARGDASPRRRARHITLPATLVVRASTAPPPAGGADR